MKTYVLVKLPIYFILIENPSFLLRTSIIVPSFLIHDNVNETNTGINTGITLRLSGPPFYILLLIRNMPDLIHSTLYFIFYLIIFFLLPAIAKFILLIDTETHQ
jgi:hypothetical protein